MKRVTIIFIAASLFIPVGTATQAQTDWKKDPGNPVLSEGLAGSWDDAGVLALEVILDGSTFKMWNGVKTRKVFSAQSRILFCTSVI